MISSSPAHIYQYLLYARYSPVTAHAHILQKKLRGEPDVYSLQELFGDPYDEPVDVTTYPWPQIDRYSAGFRHLLWARTYEKGHRVAAIVAVTGCATAIGASTSGLAAPDS